MKDTTLCYIRQNGKVLMLYRNKKEHDLNEGKWVGVGGKFEPGETAEDCLVREVLEETGLHLTDWVFHGVISFRSDVWEGEEMYLYSGTGFTGELLPDCNEGELRWVPESEVLSLNTWEGDPYFLKPLLQGRTGLQMTLNYEGDTLVSVTEA